MPFWTAIENPALKYDTMFTCVRRSSVMVKVDAERSYLVPSAGSRLGNAVLAAVGSRPTSHLNR